MKQPRSVNIKLYPALTKDWLNDFWDGYLPVKMALIAERIGIDVFFDATLEKDYEIRKLGMGHLQIAVKESHKLPMRHKSVTHALLILNLGISINDGPRNTIDDCFLVREQALKLMMGRRFLKEMLSRGRVKTIFDVMEKFAVSQTDAIHLLALYGYIKTHKEGDLTVVTPL